MNLGFLFFFLTHTVHSTTFMRGSISSDVLNEGQLIIITLAIILFVLLKCHGIILQDALALCAKNVNEWQHTIRSISVKEITFSQRKVPKTKTNNEPSCTLFYSTKWRVKFTVIPRLMNRRLYLILKSILKKSL